MPPNNLKTDKIVVGQKLKIPAKAASCNAATAGAIDRNHVAAVGDCSCRPDVAAARALTTPAGPGSLSPASLGAGSGIT